MVGAIFRGRLSVPYVGRQIGSNSFSHTSCMIDVNVVTDKLEDLFCTYWMSQHVVVIHEYNDK